MAEIAIRSLLRPSEQLKAVLDALVDDLLETDSYDSRGENSRILAVISHKEDDIGLEEGSVFLCRFRITNGDQPTELEILRVIPVTKDFKITVAQTMRESIDLSARANLNYQPKLKLTINLGQSLDSDIQHESIILYTNAIQELRTVLRECKRLIDICDGESNTSKYENRFEWLSPYSKILKFSEKFGLGPQDLRLVNQPLHDRLSPAAAGFPGDAPGDVQLIRDHYIQTKTRNSALMGRRRLKVRLGTFNVNGNLPSQDLSDWIRGNRNTTNSQILPPVEKISPFSMGELNKDPFQAIDVTSDFIQKPITSIPTTKAVFPPSEEPPLVDPDPDPDILVLGFQEIDLSAEALIYSLGPAREDAWLIAIFASLGEKGTHYEKLVSKQLVGMLIIVLVKKALVPHFTSIQTSAVGAGIMGLMGNKGGTAIRIGFTPAISDVTSPGSTILTFVNAHLAAFDEMFERRNADFRDLTTRLNFGVEAAITPSTTPPPTAIFDTDILFWMGDLNYRIDLSDGDIRRILSSEKWSKRLEALLKYDQLHRAIRSSKAFAGFIEHPIYHFPTYRFSHGVVADGLGYDIKRKPAWTDRILYMNANTVGVQQLSYTSHPIITMSDHRPVAADFVVDIDLYDTEQRDAIARKVYQSVNDIEGSYHRGAVKLSNTTIDMGKISYHSTSRTISLRNTGKGPCAYRFVPVGLDSEIHPDWLHIKPKQAILLPDELGHITFTTTINNITAARLNLGAKNLDATLILRTLLGKDHFITVIGEYQYTCFSNNLSRLIRLPGPIRSLTSPDDLRPDDRPVNAPREMLRLINWMMSEQVNVEGLFISLADESIIDVIRECLDTGEEFPFSPSSITTEIAFAFSTTLLRFLSSLVDPVVPTTLHARCVQATNRDEAFEVLDAFPPSSVNVWVSLTAFLHFICQTTNENQSLEKAEEIATLFAPVLLRDEFDPSIPPVSPLGKREFLMFFIS